MTYSELKNNWLLKWVLLSILASLLSFGAGYGFLYALAILYPLAQTIALGKIPQIRMPWLWMIYSVYWITLIQFSQNYQFAILGILLSSILGQLIIRLMLGYFGGFMWILYNSLGFMFIIIVFYLLQNKHISNDFLEVSFVIIISGLSALLSGLGIKLSVIKTHL